MKKLLLFILTVFIAYLTAFYVTGTKKGYKDPFDFNTIFNFKGNSISIQEQSVKEKGIENLERKIYEDALQNFFDALSEENTSENNYYIGHTYLLQNNYEDALHYLDIASDIDTDNSRVWLDKGIVKYYQKNYQDAINDLFLSTELSPEEAKAYYYMALCYDAQGKNEVALQSAETAVQYDSIDADSWYEAANLAYNIKEYSKSINYYKKVLNILPKDKYSELNLGLTYSKSGNDDSAMIWYDKVIQDYPDYSLAYNNKGYLYQKAEKYKLAISYYSKSIKLNSESTYPLWNRADSYYKLKEYENAIADYKKVYKINPEYYNALWYIGLCYEKLNQNKEAVFNYKNFIKKANTDNDYYQQAIQKIKKLK